MVQDLSLASFRSNCFNLVIPLMGNPRRRQRFSHIENSVNRVNRLPLVFPPVSGPAKTVDSVNRVNGDCT
jgi:hypothetical protein